MAQTQRQSGRSSLIELVTIVGLALGLFLLIQSFLVKPFRIPSESMVPTLDVGQRVLVDRVSFRFGEPERGDVVVFKPPQGADDDQSGEARCGAPRMEGSVCSRPTARRSDTNFIKRVVGLPGDKLKVMKNRVYVDGKRLDEPYIDPDSGCDDLCELPREVEIPRGYYFMMGDNRGASLDSRAWGPVPKDWIIGQAFGTYWPPGKIGTL
ncbi:MAG: signal peptidase I [Actinomycetota bacterium]|nr:signal peptidase I [Actinomycetota bacterium]